MEHVTRRPISTRLLHASIAISFAVAFATGYTAFDYDLEMQIRIRDLLFAIHRLCGMLAGILLVIWGLTRLFGAIGTAKFAPRLTLVGLFHGLLGIACFALPLFPWIGRSLNGRVGELFSFWPVFNLVSHPSTPLAYELLQLHKLLTGCVAILLAVHVAGALYHRFVLKDKILSSMLFGNF
jgi:cytochrome b561